MFKLTHMINIYLDIKPIIIPYYIFRYKVIRLDIHEVAIETNNTSVDTFIKGLHEPKFVTEVHI